MDRRDVLVMGTALAAVIESRCSVDGLSRLEDCPADSDGSTVAMGIVACIVDSGTSP